MTICRECKESSHEDAKPLESFKSIIESLEKNDLEWHLHYDSKTLRLPFTLVVEEKGFKKSCMQLRFCVS